MKTMNRMVRYGVMFLLSLHVAACSDEGTLAPSATPEPIYGKYTLPQGNHDYDPEIVDFYNQYGVLILYKFEDKDFWWNLTTDIRWRYDSVKNETSAGYRAVLADTNHVGEQLSLLKNEFFAYFSNEALQEMLPQKILLCSVLEQIPNLVAGKKPEEIVKTVAEMSPGYDYLAVNRGNENVKKMGTKEKNAFRLGACSTFLTRMITYKQVEYSAAFIAASTYTTNMTGTTQYNYGVFYLAPNASTKPEVERDWASYVEEIIAKPYRVLTGEGGILNPKIDKMGKIRVKYDIITSYYLTEYKIDLQRIGDSMVESGQTY